MESNLIKPIDQKTSVFLVQFLGTPENKKRKGESGSNDNSSQSAMLYEKIRTALEYQEEHSIFKNAIARIINRKYTLNPTITPKNLALDLISELEWANYLNNETLSKEDYAGIEKIFTRYLTILKYTKSWHFNTLKVKRNIVNWLACEIDEFLNPDSKKELLIKFAYSILKDNINLKGTRITDEDNEIQIKLTIFSLLFKPDLASIQYWIIKKTTPNWSDFSPEEAKHFGSCVDINLNKINKVVRYRYKNNFQKVIKRNIATFILIRELLQNNESNGTYYQNKPDSLHDTLMEIYDKMLLSAKEKIWRGTFRALIFIFITKISLAFILEIPIDRFFSVEIRYLSLVVNISFPPLLMLIAGTFIRTPASKNKRIVSESVDSLIFEGKISDKSYPLVQKTEGSLTSIFNFLYGVFSILILAGTVRLLVYLHFSIISIVLFFFFVSAVSFFSFRIRNIALELVMKPGRDDNLTFILEFLFIPFVRIGKFISDKFADTNPFILALDFLIEAPLKIIMKILDSWFKFLRTKREEIDI